MSAETHLPTTPEMHDPPDEWHTHTTAEERPQTPHGEVGNPRLIILVGVAAFLLVVLSTLVVYGYYVWYATGMLNSAEMNTYRDPRTDEWTLKGNAMQRLSEGWTLEGSGVEHQPLERAARQVVDRYSSSRE